MTEKDRLQARLKLMEALTAAILQAQADGLPFADMAEVFTTTQRSVADLNADLDIALRRRWVLAMQETLERGDLSVNLNATLRRELAMWEELEKGV